HTSAASAPGPRIDGVVRRSADLAGAVEDLAGRHELAPVTAERMLALLDLIAQDELAPTTVRDPRQALDDHLADSLVALGLPQVRGARSIADLGSRSGFPGLPLAVALPNSRIALVESNGRKAAFLERAILASGATNAYAVRARAEEWREGLSSLDLV